MSASDQLTRFSFASYAYRGEIVVLEKCYQEVLNRYQYPKPIAKLLGEAIAAIALIGSTVKFKGKVSLQLQGGKHLPLLFVEINHLGQLRGLAHWDGDVDEMNFQTITQGGTLAINLMPEKTQSYQGIVALEEADLASCLNQYFRQSEQLTTGFWLVTSEHRVGGLFLQEFPNATEEDKQLWPELELLSSTVTAEELIDLPTETIISRLYAEYDIQVFESSVIEFNCPCSEQKAFNSVMMLAEQEIKQILAEEGRVNSNCEFCRAEYSFDEDVLLKPTNNGHHAH